MARHEIPLMIGRKSCKAVVDVTGPEDAQVCELRTRQGTLLPLRLVHVAGMEADLIVQAFMLEAGEHAEDSEADTQVLVPVEDDLAPCRGRMRTGLGQDTVCQLYDGHHESHLSSGGLRWTRLCPGAYEIQEEP